MLHDKLLLQKGAKPKAMVLINEQDYESPSKYQRSGLKEECLNVGIKELLYIPFVN